MNKKITDLKIMFKDYLTMFSLHSSLRCVKMVTIRFLIVPVLTAFILLQGCRTTSDISAGESQQEKNRKSEEAVLASSSEDSSSLSGKTIGKDSQREERTGKENKDMELKSLYLELLGTYLKEQLGLEDYDQEIADFGCLAVAEDDQSESQKQKNMGLKYLYLRNDVHVERLTAEDREVLKAGQDAGDGDARDHAMEVVVRTFPVCITPMAIEQEEDKKFSYVYDNDVSAQDGEETVTMDTLLLRIATHAEYDEKGEYVSDYKEVQKEKKLYELKKRMESEMEGLLGDIPIRVLVDFIL